MTKKDADLIRRVQARIRQLQPELARALLLSLERLRDSLSESDFIDLLAGRVSFSALLTDGVIDRAFLPYRAAIRAAAGEGARLTIPDLPKNADRTVAAVFNYLDPVVIDAVRSLENKALATLTTSVKEVTRAFIENGIRDGLNPREMARGLRSTIGLAPHQAKYVDNLERELRTLDPAFKDRVLRDRRFDSTITKAIRDGKPIPEAKIQQISDAYRRKFTAYNTEVVTRQTALDSFRTGQRAAWESSVKNGYVDPADLVKVWVHSGLPKDPRPEHVALNGTAVPYNQPYPTGQMSAGFGDWGCACSDRFEVRTNRNGLRRSFPSLNL